MQLIFAVHTYQAKSQRREDLGQTQEKQLMKVAHEVSN